MVFGELLFDYRGDIPCEICGGPAVCFCTDGLFGSSLRYRRCDKHKITPILKNQIMTRDEYLESFVSEIIDE
jgi:hypothetical protein